MTKSISPKNIVVYADDDTDDLELVRESFTQFANNVEVVTFPDGLQALSYLANLSEMDGTPCLIILDVNMPRMGGKEALKEIRNIDKLDKVPVVLFTTSSLHMDKSFAERYQAGFLTKPIDVRQMEVITDQFINHCADEIKQKIRRQIN